MGLNFRFSSLLPAVRVGSYLSLVSFSVLLP